MYLTTKQIQIMQVVIRGNSDGSFVDTDQLIERVPYEVSKRAMQFSIRYLMRKGMLLKHPPEKRRGAQRTIYSATSLGYSVMRGGSALGTAGLG